MRLIATCFVLLCAAVPRAAFAAYDFQIEPRPSDFAFSREVDPGGGGNTYVVDHLRGTFPIPAVPVEAETYLFHFAFPDGMAVEYSADIDRIDFMASLGRLESNFGVGSTSGQNQSTLAFDVENLTLTNLTGRTVTFRDASFTSAVGVGLDEVIDVRNAAITPGAPFRLRSLDVTFRIPSQYLPSGVPGSPTHSVVLDLGAGRNLLSTAVPELGPLVRIVPEPATATLAFAAAALLLRRRGGRVGVEPPVFKL